MSKNLTRKGLALGAVVALGSSLFAGTPASAVPTSLSLDTAFGTSGTTQNGVLGEYFVLAAATVGGADGDALKFYVEGVTDANLTVAQRFVTDLTTGSGTGYSTADQTADTDPSAKIATISVNDGSTSYRAGKYVQFGLKINKTNVTSTTTIKVTPFIDNHIADDEPDSSELKGTPVSITFHKGSEVSATPTLKTAVIGSPVSATVAVDKGINVEQFRTVANGAVEESGAFKVSFFDNGGASAMETVKALWNKTDKEFVALGTATSNAAATHTYGATALVNDVDSKSATAVTATAGEVTTLDALAFSGANFNATGIVSTNVVRAGSGTFTATAKVSAVATGKLKSGQKVTFKIKEEGANTNTLVSGSSVTAGGKTLSNSSTTTAQSISVEVLTDANGVATLPITYAGLVDGNKFDVVASATGASAIVYAGAASSGVTLTAQDSSAVALVDEVLSGNSAAVRHIAKLGTFSLPYTVVDQFGQTPSGTFRVTVNGADGSATTAPAVISPVAVSGGKVTVTGTDNSLVADEYNIVVTLQKLGSNGTTYEAISTGAVAKTSVISAGTASAVSSLALTVPVTTGITRAGKDLVAGNSDLDRGTVDHSASALAALSTRAYISAVATSATGATVPGASVTFSAAGVLFVSGNVFGLGSITVVADNVGATPDVYAYSNTAGKVTVTVTSGSASKTQVLTIAEATTGGTAWTITAPSYILPGQTLKVTGVLKDKYGSVVHTGADAVKVVYTGPGYVTKDIATETDADGVVSFSVLLGAADTGSATIKFTYGGADTITADTSADDVVATATVTLGAAPATAATAAIAGSTKRFFVSVSNNTAAKNVVVKVAGKTVATLKGAKAKKTYTVKATKGSKKVTVYVGGKLIATKTVSVK